MYNNMETLLRTENLTKKFKNQVAIQNISMNVPENSVYSLLGPNGAGKSTTLKMIYYDITLSWHLEK